MKLFYQVTVMNTNIKACKTRKHIQQNKYVGISATVPKASKNFDWGIHK